MSWVNGKSDTFSYCICTIQKYVLNGYSFRVRCTEPALRSWGIAGHPPVNAQDKVCRFQPREPGSTSTYLNARSQRTYLYAMPRPELPIEALPAWSLLNNVCFLDVEIGETPGRGFGLVSGRDLNTTDRTFDRPALITIPGSLVLNHGAVEEYAKEDRNFKQLLEVAGHQVLPRPVTVSR